MAKAGESGGALHLKSHLAAKAAPGVRNLVHVANLISEVNISGKGAGL
jgi:hypothetical protein